MLRRGDNKPGTITCVGRSMNPTLKAGDLLFVEPYVGRDIRPGDVVAFYQPGTRRLVVHRIVRIGSQGIIARGDNNNRDDPWTVKREQVAGRVVSLVRRGRRMPVHGGIRGRALRSGISIFKTLSPFLSSPLRLVYHRLADSGILRKGAASFVKPGVLVFRKPEGEEVLLTLGKSGRVIARRAAGRDEWDIRRPFRLFVDEIAVNAYVEKTRGNDGFTDAIS